MIFLNIWDFYVISKESTIQFWSKDFIRMANSNETQMYEIEWMKLEVFSLSQLKISIFNLSNLIMF